MIEHIHDSFQMTFLSTGNILANKFNVIINNELYPLYTHSFLYFGMDQIRKRILKNECLCTDAKDPNCRSCVGPTGYNGAEGKISFAGRRD